jgi:hypothetical protein
MDRRLREWPTHLAGAAARQALPARGPVGTVGPAGRLHCAARDGVAPTNSLRSLRSLRSDSVGESEDEARCARRPRRCAARRPRMGRGRTAPAAPRAPSTHLDERAGGVGTRAARVRCGGHRPAPRSAGRPARARSAHRPLTCGRLSERSERSERSELGRGPGARAPQGSRRRRPPGSARRSAPGQPSAPLRTTTMKLKS